MYLRSSSGIPPGRRMPHVSPQKTRAGRELQGDEGADRKKSARTTQDGRGGKSGLQGPTEGRENIPSIGGLLRREKLSWTSQLL